MTYIRKRNTADGSGMNRNLIRNRAFDYADNIGDRVKHFRNFVEIRKDLIPEHRALDREAERILKAMEDLHQRWLEVAERHGSIHDRYGFEED